MPSLFPCPPQCLWCQQPLAPHLPVVPWVRGYGECGACRTTPATLRHRMQWIVRQAQIPARELREALATRRDGEIVRHYTMSRQTVQRYRQKWGIRYRKPRGRRDA